MFPKVQKLLLMKVFERRPADLGPWINFTPFGKINKPFLAKTFLDVIWLTPTTLKICNPSESPLKADDDEGVRVDAERDRLDVAEPVADEGAERPVPCNFNIRLIFQDELYLRDKKSGQFHANIDYIFTSVRAPRRWSLGGICPLSHLAHGSIWRPERHGFIGN